MFLAFIGVTQIAHLAPAVVEDKILDGMALALAAVVRLAVGVIFGAIDPAVGGRL